MSNKMTKRMVSVLDSRRDGDNLTFTVNVRSDKTNSKMSVQAVNASFNARIADMVTDLNRSEETLAATS